MCRVSRGLVGSATRPIHDIGIYRYVADIVVTQDLRCGQQL